MDLKEMGYEDVDWIHVAQDRVQWQTVASIVVGLQVP
jgi:hypothetical protein